MIRAGGRLSAQESITETCGFRCWLGLLQKSVLRDFKMSFTILSLYFSLNNYFTGESIVKKKWKEIVKHEDDYTKILSYKSSILIQQTRNNSVAVKSWSSDFKIDRFKNSNNWHFPFSVLR